MLIFLNIKLWFLCSSCMAKKYKQCKEFVISLSLQTWRHQVGFARKASMAKKGAEC